MGVDQVADAHFCLKAGIVSAELKQVLEIGGQSPRKWVIILIGSSERCHPPNLSQVLDRGLA